MNAKLLKQGFCYKVVSPNSEVTITVYFDGRKSPYGADRLADHYAVEVSGASGSMVRIGIHSARKYVAQLCERFANR